MKVGIRKPSIKKSIKARTTSRAKRTVKKAVIPYYGKRGLGLSKILKKQSIIKYTKKQHLVCLIYLSEVII